jgi:hypothetical protein
MEYFHHNKAGFSYSFEERISPGVKDLINERKNAIRCPDFKQQHNHRHPWQKRDTENEETTVKRKHRKQKINLHHKIGQKMGCNFFIAGTVNKESLKPVRTISNINIFSVRDTEIL